MWMLILNVVYVLVAIAIDPPVVLLAICALYALFGPVYAVWRRARRRPGEAVP